MNRSLLIPAVCSLFAFAAFYSSLNQAGDRENNSKLAAANTSSSATPLETPLPAQEAERLLTSLRDEYIQRWRAWDKSPHRLLSRHKISPFSPSSVEFVVSPTSADQQESFLLATISIKRHKQNQTVPCVVDPATKLVRIFHGKKWLTQEEWLKTVPQTQDEMKAVEK